MNQLIPPANILIRRAIADEALRIAWVLYQAFVEFEPLYTPAAFAATTPASDQIQKRWSEGPVWVATQGDQPVGTISSIPNRKGLYIRSMAVLPAARGHGIGHFLLHAAEQFAMMQGHQRMFLSTTPFLSAAIRLYEQFGFQRSNERPNELFGTPLFAMIKLLEPANEAELDITKISIE